MPKTYEPIATTTLSSDQTNIDFTNINQNYTDLIVVCNAANSLTSTTSKVLRLQVGNGTIDTGSNYSSTIVYGEASSAVSTRASNSAFTYNGETLGTIDKAHSFIIQIQNYSNASTYKTMLTRGGTTLNLQVIASVWRNTSAINQIRLSLTSDQFESGSTFTVYGIKAA